MSVLSPQPVDELLIEVEAMMNVHLTNENISHRVVTMLGLKLKRVNRVQRRSSGNLSTKTA